MLLLIELVLVLGLAAVAAGLFLRRRRAAERDSVTRRRVSAYIQTIRRDAGNSALAGLSEAELEDLLLSSARNLKVQSERKFYLLVGGAFMVLLSAIVIGSTEGTKGFAITAVVGALVLYGLNEFLGRRMREPLREKGIDAERLRVE